MRDNKLERQVLCASINQTSKWWLGQRSEEVVCHFQHNKAVNMNSDELEIQQTMCSISGVALLPRGWYRFRFHGILHTSSLVSSHFQTTESRKLPVPLQFTPKALEYWRKWWWLKQLKTHRSSVQNSATQANNYKQTSLKTVNSCCPPESNTTLLINYAPV